MTSSYGLFIVETVAALIVIAAAGWLVVRLAGGRLLAGRGNRRMKIIERLPLEPRRSLHLVEVDGEVLLVGTSEQSVQLLERRPSKPSRTEKPNGNDSAGTGG